MQHCADQQQSKQDEGEAFGAPGINQAFPFFKLGAAHQRVGKNKPADQKSCNRPPPGKSDLGNNKHGKTGGHAQRGNPYFADRYRARTGLQADENDHQRHEYSPQSGTDMQK
ncbi:hypothetical protein D3C73_1326370 [compost metagenome]